MRLVMRAGFWGASSQEQGTTLDDSTSAQLRFLVDAPHGLLVGKVVDDQTSQPVAGAEVRLQRIADAHITTPDGGFRFGRVPPGTYQVQVRHFAFATVLDTLDVDVSTSVEATIRVSPDVIPLAPISVIVRSLVLERAGFYQRQERRSGHFITRQQVQDQSPLQPSELLQQIPGVRFVRGRDGLLALARANCPFRFVIDEIGRTTSTFTIDLIPTGDIEGLEVYLGPSRVRPSSAPFRTKAAVRAA